VNADLCQQAVRLGTCVLPKQLAAEIPIRIASSVQEGKHRVFVEDDLDYARSLIDFIFDNDPHAYHFQFPDALYAELDEHPKDTRIFLDNQYGHGQKTGLQVAKELYEQGFTHVCLLSGQRFRPGEIPDYVTVIAKDDFEAIKNF